MITNIITSKFSDSIYKLYFKMDIIMKVSLILLSIKLIGKLLIKLISVSFIWFTELFMCGSCKVKNDDGGFPLCVLMGRWCYFSEMVDDGNLANINHIRTWHYMMIFSVYIFLLDWSDLINGACVHLQIQIHSGRYIKIILI